MEVCHPFGTDDFIINFLSRNVKDYEETYQRMIDNSDETNVGACFSLSRLCMATRWPYLYRVIAPRLWKKSTTDAKGAEQTLEDIIDDSTIELAIHQANITMYRKSLTKPELKLARERAGLRLKNGGLGIHLCSHMANAAYVGAW